MSRVSLLSQDDGELVINWNPSVQFATAVAWVCWAGMMNRMWPAQCALLGNGVQQVWLPLVHRRLGPFPAVVWCCFVTMLDVAA